MIEKLDPIENRMQVKHLWNQIFADLAFSKVPASFNFIAYFAIFKASAIS